MMENYGVLVISHGSNNQEWVTLVDEAVQEIKLEKPIPIVSCFLEIVSGRLIQDGIDALEIQGVNHIITIPLFVSSGSTHMDEISYALGIKEEAILETDLERMRGQAYIHLCSPIDEDPIATEIIYNKIKELSTHPNQEVLILVGHGSDVSGFHEKWQVGLNGLIAQLQLKGGFDQVDAAMLKPDQLTMKMKKWHKNKPQHKIIIAPLFLSEGYFTKKVIPNRCKGFEYSYNGKAMLPSPLISKWMTHQIENYLINKSINR